MPDEKPINEQNVTIDRRPNPGANPEKITVQPIGDQHMGDVTATLTQMKTGGLIQGHEITAEGAVVQLWPRSGDRVREIGGFDAYVALLDSQLKARGLQRAQTAEEQEKVAADQQAQREADDRLKAEQARQEEADRQRLADEEAKRKDDEAKRKSRANQP